MTDDHLYDLVIEWDRRRKIGQLVSPEELCKDEPELLEDLKVRIESVKRTDWLFESDETTDDGDFLTLPDIKKIVMADETLPTSTLTVEQFTQAIATSGLMTSEAVQSVQRNASAENARDLAVALVGQGKLTHYQASVLLEGGKEPLVLDRYVILERLDAGGMGQVFKALHRPMERVVALKMPPPASVDSPEKVKRFQREVRAAAKLSHPNIVTAHDACESGGIHFLIMELVDGRDFHKLVNADGPLSVSKAVAYIVQAARGLEHAHANGIVHRDIKPSNLLLDKNGTVKVLDLGLARFESPGVTQTTSQDLTEAGIPMGTVAFMSPEQALDAKHADHRSDIYSLGCTLYFLLTGRPPYREDTPMKTVVAHRERAVPSLRADRAEVPEALDAVYGKMVAKRPEDRYQSIAEVIEALERCEVPEEGVPTTAANVREPLADVALSDTQTYPLEIESGGKTQVKTQRRRIGVGVAVGLLLVALVFAGIIFNIKTSGGTVVLECNQSELDGAVVTVDGEEKITIKMHEKAEPITIRVDKGRRRLEVVKGGFKTFTDEFEIGGGEKKPITVRLEPLAEVGKAVDPHRKAAEWVLGIGGTVTVMVDGDASWTDRIISSRETLPSVPFCVKVVLLGKLGDKIGEKVTDKDIGTLESLYSSIPLDNLRLIDVAMTDAGVLHIAKMRIWNLSLAGTQVTDRGLPYLKEVKGLTHLGLDRTKVSDEGMKHIADCVQLEGLWLSDIGDAGLQYLETLKNLKMFSPIHCRITDSGIERMCSNHPKLWKLQLQFNMLGDATMEHLARLPMLEHLEIGWTRVSDAGLVHLAEFPSLKLLDVTGNKVTNVGLGHVAAAGKLENLGLCGAFVSDEGLTHLGRLTELRNLDLRDTAITNAGLKHLYVLKKLQSLNVTGTKVTAEGVKALKAALPNCNVVWKPPAEGSAKPAAEKK